jgi:hypothetical protein
MLFYSMLRRIPMLTFNELFDLIVPSQPTCLLIHLTSAIHCLNGSAFFEGILWIMRNTPSIVAACVL